MLTKEEKDIIHEIALRYNVKDYVAEDVVLHVFRTLSDIMESWTPKEGEKPINVGVVNFGKFVVSKRKRTKIDKRYGKRNQDINEGEENISEGTSNDPAADGLDIL